MTQQSLTLQGPAGALEALHYQAATPRNVIAVICHPHPLFQGTMHNKVVTTVAKAFEKVNVSSVVFNYRGVGASEGTYGNGEGEIHDTLAVITWAQTQFPDHSLWLAGFSFGGYIARAAATLTTPEILVTVAPSVANFNIAALAPIHCPWLVCQGMEDDVVPADQVIAYAHTQNPMPTIVEFAETSHFFHGKLVELRETIVDYCQHHEPE